MSTTKARRGELAAQRAELAARMKAVRKSVHRLSYRINWSAPENRKYNPLPAKTPDLGRLNGRQLDALKKRLDEWAPRRLRSTASGQIIAPGEIERMQHARKLAYDRAYRAARRVNKANPAGRKISAAEIMDMQGRPVRPRSTRNVKDKDAYRRLSAATGRLARSGPAAKQRAILSEMMRGVAIPNSYKRRLKKLSDAGILFFRGSARAMNALKDLYLAAGEEAGGNVLSQLDIALAEAEAV